MTMRDLIPWGRRDRSAPVPQFDPDEVSASLRNDVLTVTAGTRSDAERAVRRIPIRGDAMPTVPSFSALPPDAEAIVYRPARSPMTSGRAQSREWVLEFLPRSAPAVEPLMGWTSSDDPLSSVRIRFPSAEAAERYAERQGLRYAVRRERTRAGMTGGDGRAAGVRRRRRAVRTPPEPPLRGAPAARPWHPEFVEAVAA
jgi:hypothetical protein